MESQAPDMRHNISTYSKCVGLAVDIDAFEYDSMMETCTLFDDCIEWDDQAHSTLSVRN